MIKYYDQFHHAIYEIKPNPDYDPDSEQHICWIQDPIVNDELDALLKKENKIDKLIGKLYATRKPHLGKASTLKKIDDQIADLRRISHAITLYVFCELIAPYKFGDKVTFTGYHMLKPTAICTYAGILEYDDNMACPIIRLLTKKGKPSKTTKDAWHQAFYFELSDFDEIGKEVEK